MLIWLLNQKPEPDYSNRKIIQVAKEKGHEIEFIDPNRIDVLITSDNGKSVILDGEKAKIPDLVIPRTGARTTYFHLAIMRHLQKLGCVFLNQADPIENVMDKMHTMQLLAAEDIPIPKTMLAKFPVNLDLIEKRIGFPAVVKTVSGSLGSGVVLEKTRKEFESLMDFIAETKAPANFLIQEFVEDSAGRDLRVIVIGGKIICCIQRTSADGDFRANISRGGYATRFDITPQLEMLSLEIAKILDLDIAGIDYLFDGDSFKVCEANSSPQFEGMEKACEEIDIAKSIIEYGEFKTGLE